MPDSIKVARIAFVVAAGLEIATAALFLFIFGSGAVLIGWGTERSGLLGSALLGAAGVALAALIVPFDVADFFIRAGIAKGRPWARFAGIAMGLVLLVGVIECLALFHRAIQPIQNPIDQQSLVSSIPLQD